MDTLLSICSRNQYLGRAMSTKKSLPRLSWRASSRPSPLQNPLIDAKTNLSIFITLLKLKVNFPK